MWSSCWILLFLAPVFGSYLDQEQCVTSTEKTPIHFLWEIGQFQMRGEMGSESIRSPNFHDHENPSSWQIVLYPSLAVEDAVDKKEEDGFSSPVMMKQCQDVCMGSMSKGSSWVDMCLARCDELRSEDTRRPSSKGKPHQRWIGLYLCLNRAKEYPQRVLFTLSALPNYNNTKAKVASKFSPNPSMFRQGNCRGWKEFLPRRKVISQHLNQGHLKIVASIDVLDDVEVCSSPGKEYSDRNGEQQECLWTSRRLKEELEDDTRNVSDISFSVGDRQFRVHLAILSVRIPKLLKELSPNKSGHGLPLTDADASDVLQLLRYVYGGTVPKASNITSGLLNLCKRFEVSGLLEESTRTLEEALNVDSAARVLQVADAHHLDDLKEKAWAVVLEDTQGVMETQGWKVLVQGAPHLASEAFRRMVDLSNKADVTTMTPGIPDTPTNNSE